MTNKRKWLIISAICIVIALVTAILCVIGNKGLKDQGDFTSSPSDKPSFAVYYLDVGQGDCIFINFPDGKNMLIDTGESNSVNDKYLQDFFFNKKISKIDYFILTHTDDDHVGNAHYFLDNFEIENMFLPYVSQPLMELLPDFKAIMDKVEEKEIDYCISDYHCSITGDDYAIAFLSPLPKDFNDSAYGEFNSTLTPSDKQKNNISPIIYLECFGARFLFTGDAQAQSERVVVDRYRSGIYDFIHKDKVKVNLENIDYLKLGHHGSEDASCEEFLSLLQPKNVVISVGGDNYYGHPSTDVFTRLDQLNIEYDLYRTDTNGTICVKYLDGQFKEQVEVQ